MRAPDPDHAATPTSLVFETECLARRVRHFPANWRELDDAELEALSERH